MLPLNGSAAFGVNETANVRDSFGRSDALGGSTVNAGGDAVALVIVNKEDPLFVTTMLSVFVAPRSTFLKFKFAGWNVRFGATPVPETGTVAGVPAAS
jgi:hypothetical protein